MHVNLPQFELKWPKHVGNTERNQWVGTWAMLTARLSMKTKKNTVSNNFMGQKYIWGQQIIKKLVSYRRDHETLTVSKTLQLLYQVMKYSSLHSTVCHQVCLTDGHSGSFSYHDNISLHSSAPWLWKCTRRQRENVRRWGAATEHNKQSPLTGLLWLQIA